MWQVVGTPERCKAGPRCTTSQPDAHVTNRTVLYPWHPWFNESVAVEGSMFRNGVSTFRCRLRSAEDGKSRDVPQWMFDSVACAGLKTSDQPYVSVFALRRLVRLLNNTCSGERNPSDIAAQRALEALRETLVAM